MLKQSYNVYFNRRRKFCRITVVNSHCEPECRRVRVALSFLAHNWNVRTTKDELFEELCCHRTWSLIQVAFALSFRPMIQSFDCLSRLSKKDWIILYVHPWRTLAQIAEISADFPYIRYEQELKKSCFVMEQAFLVRSTIFPGARAANSAERLESLSRLVLLALVYLASIYRANHGVITRGEFRCVFSSSIYNRALGYGKDSIKWLHR